MADIARYAANSDRRTERPRERRDAESSEQRETRLEGAVWRIELASARFAAISRYETVVIMQVLISSYAYILSNVILYILWYIVQLCFLETWRKYIYVAMDLIPILLGSLPLAHNAQHSLVMRVKQPCRTTRLRCLYNWGEGEPHLGSSTRPPVCLYIYNYIYRTSVIFGPAAPALRANVAGRIGNRVSPAESAFSACIGSGSSQT